MIYKIEWEMVSPIGSGAAFYANERPICRPEQVAEEHWHRVTRETDNPWQQYHTLKAWAENGRELIRKVHLFVANETTWRPYGQEPHPMDKDYLKQAGTAIKAKLPDNHGFILLVAPFGEPSENSRLSYISTLTRETAINVLKEWLIKASGPEEWMKHIV
jgi:hypothetical protein